LWQNKKNGAIMNKLIVVSVFLLAVITSAAESVPMKFCGLKLGQKLPDGISPTSKTEMYYGYRLPAKETILKFNQYQFHASIISKTITNAGAGYTTTSKSDAEELFSETCRWLEKKYPGKKCEDYKIPNRKIKVMRFGVDTDGYYMVEINSPMPGMHLVMISLYNDELSKLEEREAKEFASKQLVGQAAPLQFNLQQVNSNLNQGISIVPSVANSAVSRTASQTTTKTTAFDQTKDTMGAIREAIESYQRQNKTRAAPKIGRAHV
jgi:hypothetical protein